MNRFHKCTHDSQPPGQGETYDDLRYCQIRGRVRQHGIPNYQPQGGRPGVHAPAGGGAAQGTPLFAQRDGRGLVNQATRIIGILLMDIRTLHHTDGVYYIERELEKLGYCCIIMNSGSTDAEKAEYIRRLSRRRVEGAILIGSGFQNDTVRQAISEYLPDTPVVLVNGMLDLPNVYGVLSDERSGMERCVERLVAAGHVHPAFVIDTQTPSNLLKRAGYEQGVLRCCPGMRPWSCTAALPWRRRPMRRAP